MAKLTLRDDGTCYVRATVVPGSQKVRTWEVKKEGVQWLAKQGVRVGQEMGRRRFQALLDMRLAYIANYRDPHRAPKGKQPTTSPRRPGPQEESRSPRVWKISEKSMQSAVVPKSRTARKKKVKQQSHNSPSGTTVKAQPRPDTPEVVHHWKRRTKKKNWFN